MGGNPCADSVREIVGLRVRPIRLCLASLTDPAKRGIEARFAARGHGTRAREGARILGEMIDWIIENGYAQGSPSQLSGGPGCHLGYGAYASAGDVVSVSTPAPWRSASSERG